MEIQEQFSERLTWQASLLMPCYIARHVSPKCISVWLFTVETLSFALKSSLEFVFWKT